MTSKADIKRQSGSPFRPPRYTEPTNVRETRKMRQSKFRRKYQEVRAINKSLYAQPGLETDDYNWNNYKYSNKPQYVPQTKTDNTTKFPESFVSLHGFQPGKELDSIHHRKDRPRSADSINSLSSLTSLKKHNQFDDTTSKYDRDRPKTASDNKITNDRATSAPISNDDKKRALQWSPYFKRTPMSYPLLSVDKSIPITHAYTPSERAEDSQLSTLRHPHVNKGTASEPNPIFGTFYKGISVDMNHYSPKLVSNDLAEMAKKKPVIISAETAEFIGEQDVAKLERERIAKIRQEERQNKMDDEIERNKVKEMLRSFGPKKEPELPVDKLFPRFDTVNKKLVEANKMFRGKDVKRSDKVGKNYDKKKFEKELKRFNATEKERKMELKLVREVQSFDPLNINVKISDSKEEVKSYSRRRKSSISMLTTNIVKDDGQRRRRSSISQSHVDIAKQLFSNTTTNIASITEQGEKVRPGSAPYRLVAKKTNEDKFYITGQVQAKERKRRGTTKLTDHYYSHLSLGDGQLVSSINPVHFVTGHNGKLVEIQLKSKEVLRERPKSADAALKNHQNQKYVEKKVHAKVLGPEYGFENKLSVAVQRRRRSSISQSHVDVAKQLISSKTSSNLSNTNNTNTDTTTSIDATTTMNSINEDNDDNIDIDLEAADRRRSKTVQSFRRKSRVIIENRQEEYEKMMKLCLAKDVTFTRATEGGQLKDWREENIAFVEKEAMKLFFEKMSGANWANKSNWCTDEPLSKWHGLTIHNGALCEIHLPRNRLIGIFPYPISECKYLEVLNIDFNQLTGSFPNHILRCCQFLEVISARGNKFSGEVPFQVFAMMPNLREIWLSDNQFTGRIDEKIGDIKKLTHLCLYKNQISGSIPNEIENCERLELLSLGRNKMSGRIPDGLRALNNLTHLSLYLNNFTGLIPEWLDDNPNIKELNLFHNNFEGYVPVDAQDLYRVRIERLDRIKKAGDDFDFSHSKNDVRKQLFDDNDDNEILEIL